MFTAKELRVNEENILGNKKQVSEITALYNSAQEKHLSQQKF
jgi:hypothetical protein